MKHPGQFFRTITATALAFCLAADPVRALVTLNDGHDRIFVTGTLGVSHDSNVFASNGSPGDFLYTTGFSADYQRRAGWIGVNANVGISGAHYGSLKGQDYSDPTFGIELNKRSGRTTGSLTLDAARETRADAAINTRNTSWNYSTGLSFRYHIVGTNDLSGNLGYTQRKYLDDATYANLSTYTANFELFHLFNTERDLIAGYRYRYNETSRHSSSSDHAFSLGLHGKIFTGVTGTLRGGYQYRVPHGRKAPGDHRFDSWTASGSVNYPINRKINLSASISKDFSTTATESSVDGLVCSLDGQYAINSHWNVAASTGWGKTTFLGESGRPILDPGPPAVLGPQREDSYINWSVSSGYSFSEHLKLSLNYLWFKNFSTITFADFVRSSWSFSLSSRW